MIAFNLTQEELEIESKIAWRSQDLVTEWAYQYNIFTNKTKLCDSYLKNEKSIDVKRASVKSRYPLPSADWRWHFSESSLI